MTSVTFIKLTDEKPNQNSDNDKKSDKIEIKELNFHPRLKSEKFRRDFEYVQNRTFEQRLNEAYIIRKKHPGQVPIIIQYDPKFKPENISKKKFVIPGHAKVSNLMEKVRSFVKLPPEDAIFLLADNYSLNGTKCMAEVDKEFCCDDGLIYIACLQESAFG